MLRHRRLSDVRHQSVSIRSRHSTFAGSWPKAGGPRLLVWPLAVTRPSAIAREHRSRPRGSRTTACVVQTCVVHLIRNSIRYCSWKDRKAVTKALKPVYQAPSVEAAADALDNFELEWGETYPAIVDLWRRNWERFTPFLAFDAPIRKIIYTTNAIESLNYQLRKVTKTRGHFPTDDAVLKILYLAIGNIGNHRGGQLGTGTQGWKQALNAFAITFPGRLDPTT